MLLLIGYIVVDRQSTDIVFTADGSMAVVSHLLFPSPGRISILDVATRSLVGTVEIDGAADAVAVVP